MSEETKLIPGGKLRSYQDPDANQSFPETALSDFNHEKKSSFKQLPRVTPDLIAKGTFGKSINYDKRQR